MVPFHNEHFSVLLRYVGFFFLITYVFHVIIYSYRTAYSALNRAPANLIEVILVDDASTKGWDFRFLQLLDQLIFLGTIFAENHSD